ncbi:MAG: hypothetical protein Q9166_006240 [cf. Caloplaca sp. 2 TL-2023]
MTEEMTEKILGPKACTAKKGPCYCEKCSPGSSERIQKYQELKNTPICRLPPELLNNILERVDLVNFPPFMIATYHILRMRTMIPPYPSAMLKLMLLREEEGEDKSASLQTMPQELLLAIGQTLTPNEKVHMVLATYRMHPEEIEIITHQS